MNRTTSMMTRLAIIVLLFTVAEVVGNCAGVANLYGVSVKLKGGREVSGFLAWNSDRVTITELLSKLNEFASTGKELPIDISGQNPIVLYRGFKKIKYPFETKVVKKEDSLEIKLQEVSAIKEKKELNSEIGEAGTEVPVMPEKDIQELNREPIYVYSKGFYGSWREYFVAVSSSARIVDAVWYETRYAKSIVFFGEFIGMYDFSSARIECVKQSKSDLEICNAAKHELEQLKIDGQEISKYRTERDRVERLMSGTTAYPSVFKTPEYLKTENEWRSISSKYDEKYQSQLKQWENTGFVHVRLKER